MDSVLAAIMVERALNYRISLAKNAQCSVPTQPMPNDVLAGKPKHSGNQHSRQVLKSIVQLSPSTPGKEKRASEVEEVRKQCGRFLCNRDGFW
jgi:hypothetical protein